MPLVWVVVLGDIGRSPRMQYHAHSLCQTPGYSVALLGNKGAALHDDLQPYIRQGVLTVHHFPDTPSCIQPLFWPLRLLLKALFQLLAILHTMLFRVPAPATILAQLPPALPLAPACALAASFYGARLVFDWHNYAWSLMALSLGRRHPLVRLARFLEARWGSRADAALCVSGALAEDLARGGILAATLPDRPAPRMRPAALPESHELLVRLRPALLASPQLRGDWLSATTAGCEGPEETFRTRRGEGRSTGGSSGGLSPSLSAAVRADVRASVGRGMGLTGEAAEQGSGEQEEAALSCRGAPSVLPSLERSLVAVSATSWTPDEDFGLLIRAAQMYDARAREREEVGQAAAKARPDGRGGACLPEGDAQEPPLPRLALLVTGRGPLRARYEREMAALDLEHVALRTLWLEPGDYPLLLGSADVGVSLHASSSGLDLPMKVVDAQGCGLPVCALRYPCLERELVREGVDGLLFETAEGLAESLVELGESVGQPQGLLHCLRAGARDGSKETWQQAWDRVALPLL